MDEQLLRNRSVLRDFTVTTLAAIPNLYGRLTYIASLRDLSSGSYEHSGLAAVYPKEAVQEALECCHSEIFRKILETPLSIQEGDLRECLEAMSKPLEGTVSHWRHLEAYRILPPENAISLQVSPVRNRSLQRLAHRFKTFPQIALLNAQRSL